MKIKNITGEFLMIVETVFLVLLAALTSLFIEINSSSILKTMNKSGYLDKAEINAREALNNYLPEEKTEELLKSISVKSQIKDLIKSLDNNTVEQVSIEKKDEIKNEIIKRIDSSVDNTTKESFAQTVSDAYIKRVFPAAEFKVLSKINSIYSEKLIFSIVIILIITIVIYIYLATGKKTYKWAIIGIYNSIFFSILIYILSGMFNNISIGNIDTTKVFLEFINKVHLNIIIVIFTLVLLAIFSNWRAYFRKKKSSRKR